MEILGYIGALVIGLVLGLIGGGGSILTVPVLVFLLDVEPIVATAYSLFIVGIGALAGSLQYYRRGQVAFKTGVVFAIPAFVAVFATRRFIIPAIPDTIADLGFILLTKDVAVMILFALLMITASISMIRGRKIKERGDDDRLLNIPLIAVEGIVVGVLTGLVGAGGGFLIIPALVVLARLPMKEAVGTSLMIIAAKSLIGFLGDIGQMPIDWLFLIFFALLTIGGIFIGLQLSHKISGARLKPVFGWFVLVMGTFILIKEIAL